MTVEQDVKAMKEACDQHKKEISDRLGSGAQRFATIDGRLDNLETWQRKQGDCLQSLEEKIGELVAAVTNVRLEIATGRPSWAIVAVLTVLFSLCSGLIVYVVTNI